LEPLLLGLGITLLPVYSFQSGTVQYAHMVLTVLVLMRFSHSQTSLRRPEIFLICLTILSLVVESLAVMVASASTLSLFEPAYMLFNTLIVLTFIRLPLNERPFRIALVGSLIASTLIATVSVWYYGASLTVVQIGWERASGLFNNPNQQAYFAVCVASIVGLLYLRGVVDRKLCLMLWAATLVLVMVAVSRTSSVSMLVLLAFGLASFVNKERLSPAVMLGAVTVIGLVWLAYDAGLLDSLQFIERIKDTGTESADSLTSRGYIIPYYDPLSFLFGVGAEQARVGSIFHRIEVHSTWWSFMGKYGLIGFLLYMGTWVVWTRLILKERGLLGFMIVIVPSIVTGLTGNYSRFTPMYVLIGLSLNRSLTLFRQRPAGAQVPPIDLLARRPQRPAGAMAGSAPSAPRQAR
jgi:hypothetical protein